MGIFCPEWGADTMNSYLANVIFLGTVSAGFPSPGDDWREQRLNLHDLVVEHNLSTYFMKIAGDSMVNACLHAGDIVVVDRALTASHKKIMVARLGDRFTLKRLWFMPPKIYLRPENPKYQPVEVTNHPDFEIFGVVTYCVQKVR
jgi:DNA polymerase V